MKIYNTESRKIENINPIKQGQIKLYSCGPTVYDKPTIGNWASFLRYDILVRALRSSGFGVDWTMNITDVGHLVSDADEGEDKLEKGARRESKTAWEIAEYYSKYFLEGLDHFNISIPRKNIAKATDYISQQIDMIKILEGKNHTYQIDDGVYFDSTTFADYGKMARLDLTGLKEGVRVASGGKKHPTDFALWKFSPKGKKRDMEWDSPWGKGFPGWHLECSAIILSTLGETIDIHMGGIEHIPLHHTNEIAQSESATGKKLANTWVHNNHLKIDGGKISKSLNNGYTIEDLKDNNFSAKDFRMFVLHSNYRTESNFSWEILSEARQKRLELQAAADLRYQSDSIQKSSTRKIDISQLKTKIKEAIESNLNTPVVVSVLSQLTQQLSDDYAFEDNEFTSFLSWLDELLGLELLSSNDVTSEQKQLIVSRDSARDNQDWAKADKIRDELLKEHGIGLKDTEKGSMWFRTS